MTKKARPGRELLPEALVIECIREGNNFDPAEDLSRAGGFVLFEGPGIRTWLIATRLRLYCVADDQRRNGPRILWSISRSRLFEEKKFSLEVHVHREDGGDRVDIGYRKSCAFSPELFASTGLKERIEALVREKMG